MITKSTLLEERKKKVRQGLVGLVTLVLLVSAAVIAAKVIASDKAEEIKCRSYGNQMGYDIEYVSGTCFVHLDHGITVPLNNALALQEALYINRLEKEMFK